MRRMEPGRFVPPFDGPCANAHELSMRNKQLERDLRERDAQVRSLNAEVHRLQQLVPRAALKGQRRPTRAEKQARNRPQPCL